MYEKFKEQKPYALLDTSKYPPEVAGRFNSFIVTQFDDSLSVEMQMRSIIKWAIDNFKLMDQTYNAFTEYVVQGNLNPFIQFLNDLIEYMNEFIDTFDERYQETILEKMQEWYDNGELETLINESLDTKYHQMDERLTEQLVQTEKKVNRTIGSNKTEVLSTERGAVSFIIDDAYVADYDYVLPAIQDENVPLNISVITNRIDTNDFMTKEQLLSLQNEYGWEILSHTVSHTRLGDLSETQQEAELRNSKQTLTSLGLKVNSIAYPFGSHTDTTKELARKYYRSARSTDFGLNGLNNSPIDTFGLKTIWLDGTAVMPDNDPSGYQANQIEYYQYYIDLAQETGQWLNILMHGNQMKYYDHAPLLKEVIQYAKGKIDILTVNDALDRYGNIVDIGVKKEEEPYKEHFAVGFDGKSSSNTLPTVWVENNKFDGSHSILDFPTYQATFNKVFTQRAKDTDLPEGNGGVLVTYKIERERTANPFFNYQVYHSLYSGNSFKRLVLNGNSWGDWKQINNALHSPLETNRYTTQTPITDFSDGLTISRISASKAEETNAPRQMGGELITYKYAQSLGYSFQEYIIYGTNEKYGRSVNDDGSYKEWRKLNVSKTVATPWTSLPAGSLTTIELSPSELTTNSVVTVKPKGNIPTSVLFSYNVRQGKVVLKFYNTSSNDTALDAMDWVVHMVDTD